MVRPPFRINLLRGRVPSRRVRRMWFVGLVAYVALMGVAIAWGVFRATTGWMDLSVRRAGQEMRERAFLAGKGRTITFDQYAGVLDAQARHCAASLESVRGFLAARGRVGETLVGLAAALPAGIELGEADIHAVSNTVSASVYVPASREGDPAASPTSIMSAWSKGRLPAVFAGRFVPRSTQRVRMDREAFISLGFDAGRKQEPPP